jgi:hypothetical protein
MSNIAATMPCRDEENPYLSSKAPMGGAPPTMGQRFWKEMKQNWWLWGSVVFAILLVGGLLLFRNQLYDSATHGLPFLAGRTPALERYCMVACLPCIIEGNRQICRRMWHRFQCTHNSHANPFLIHLAALAW